MIEFRGNCLAEQWHSVLKTVTHNLKLLRWPLSTVPADVFGCLFIGAVEEQHRVVAWHVVPPEDRVKPEANGPQPRKHGHRQDQQLEKTLTCQQQTQSGGWRLGLSIKDVNMWLSHTTAWGGKCNLIITHPLRGLPCLDWIHYLSPYYLALSFTDKWLQLCLGSARTHQANYNLPYFFVQHCSQTWKHATQTCKRDTNTNWSQSTFSTAAILIWIRRQTEVLILITWIIAIAQNPNEWD